MNLSEIERLIRYNEWANARVFGALEGLEGHEIEAKVASSFSSIRKTLAHIVMVEWVWLRRWQGESPTAPPAWGDTATLSQLRDHLRVIEADRRTFLSGLQDGDLSREVTYRNLKGEPGASLLGDLLVHYVNHSTYHRGQIATQMRQVGAQPVATDFLLFCVPR